MGAPPACAACDLYCTSNIVTTVMDLVDAIWFDVMTVVRLIAVCFGKFGLSGCLCQLSVSESLWSCRKLLSKRRMNQHANCIY